jgi:small subunit ribosomal protein S19
MIGHRLGEFAPTRRFGGHVDKKAAKGKMKWGGNSNGF